MLGRRSKSLVHVSSSSGAAGTRQVTVGPAAATARDTASVAKCDSSGPRAAVHNLDVFSDQVGDLIGLRVSNNAFYNRNLYILMDKDVSSLANKTAVFSLVEYFIAIMVWETMQFLK